MAGDLLKKGRTSVKGMWFEKEGLQRRRSGGAG